MKHQYAVFVAVVAAAIGFANAAPIGSSTGTLAGNVQARGGLNFDEMFGGQDNKRVDITGDHTVWGDNSPTHTSTSTSSSSTSTSTSTSTSSSAKATHTKAADKKKDDADKKKQDETKKNVDKMDSVDKEAYWRKFIHTLLSDEPIDKKGKQLEDIISDIKKGTKLPDNDDDKKHAKDSESKKKDGDKKKKDDDKKKDEDKKKKDEDKKKKDEDEKKKKDDEDQEDEEDDKDKRSLRSEPRAPVEWSHPLSRSLVENSDLRARGEQIFAIAARAESDDAAKKAAVEAIKAITDAIAADVKKSKRDLSPEARNTEKNFAKIQLGEQMMDSKMFDRRAAGEGAPPSARSLNARRVSAYKPVTIFSRDDDSDDSDDDEDKKNITWVRPNKWGIKPLFGSDNSTSTSLSDRLKTAKDNFFNAIKGDDKKNSAATAHAPAVLITASFAAASAAGVFLLA